MANEQRDAAQRRQSNDATDAAATLGPSGSPFADEYDTLTSREATKDDVSAAQASPEAAAQVSAAHLDRLIYPPGYQEMSPLAPNDAPHVDEILTDRGVNPPDPNVHLDDG